MLFPFHTTQNRRGVPTADLPRPGVDLDAYPSQFRVRPGKFDSLYRDNRALRQGWDRHSLTPPPSEVTLPHL